MEVLASSAGGGSDSDKEDDSANPNPNPNPSFANPNPNPNQRRRPARRLSATAFVDPSQGGRQGRRAGLGAGPLQELRELLARFPECPEEIRLEPAPPSAMLALSSTAIRAVSSGWGAVKGLWGK